MDSNGSVCNVLSDGSVCNVLSDDLNLNDATLPMGLLISRVLSQIACIGHAFMALFNYWEKQRRIQENKLLASTGLTQVLF